MFEIFGDDFPVEKITEILNIKPSSISRKGEKINDVAYKKETAWSIDTGEIESLDLNDQIQQILVLIKDKEEQLLEIKKDYSVSFLISIVISIRDHYCPSIFLMST